MSGCTTSAHSNYQIPPWGGSFFPVGNRLYTLPSPEPSSHRFIEICPGDVPFGDVGPNLPWLAFCLGQSLKGKEPCAAPTFSPTGAPLRMLSPTGTGPPALMINSGFRKAWAWLFSATRFARSAYEPGLLRGDYLMKMRSILRPTLREGLVRSHYAVLEWTNYAGQQIPTKFELVEYGNNGEWSPRIYFRAVGLLSTIRHAAKPEGVIVASTNQFVNDYRFRTPDKLVDFLHYAWTSSATPSTSLDFHGKPFA